MKVLVIGLGSIARKHIEVLKKLHDNLTIYAWRRNHEVETFVDGVINIYEPDPKLINDLDFVMVSNTTAAHFDTLLKVKDFNKPLFIEKPLFAHVSDETDQVVNDLLSSSTITYVACNLRFLHCLQELKRILENERINEVNVYCGSYLPDWRPGTDYKTSYSAQAELGGGVHIDLIHELDYVYWIFGLPTQHRSHFSNRSSLNISAYDYANYLWQYDGYAVSIVLNYYRRDAKRMLEVLTDKGTFVVDLLDNSICFNGKVIFKSEDRIIDTYYTQMEHFLNVIAQKTESINTVKEANAILKLCIQD